MSLGRGDAGMRKMSTEANAVGARLARGIPPHRLVLIWQINAIWQYDSEFETEVEITFEPEGPGRTRVNLEHRNLDRFGEHEQGMREGFGSPGGWMRVLEAYAELATG